MEPTIGRIVHYRVKPEDLERLEGAPTFVGNRLISAKLVRDGLKVDRLEWAGNVIRPGDVFPMVVVRPWFAPGQYAPGVSVLNGHVLLDGPGALWALSVGEGTEPGTWCWPPKS